MKIDIEILFYFAQNYCSDFVKVLEIINQLSTCLCENDSSAYLYSKLFMLLRLICDFFEKKTVSQYVCLLLCCENSTSSEAIIKQCCCFRTTAVHQMFHSLLFQNNSTEMLYMSQKE